MNGNELESLAGDWPGVASSIKWEDDLVFTVAGKMFAVYCLRGPHRERISFKVDPERFLELTDQPGISPAAYMARAFWISIAEPDRFARAKLSEFVRHSYDLVRGGLSKKQQASLAAKERPQSAATTAQAVQAAEGARVANRPGAAKKPAKARSAKVARSPDVATPAKPGAAKVAKAPGAAPSAKSASPTKRSSPIKSSRRSESSSQAGTSTSANVLESAKAAKRDATAAATRTPASMRKSTPRRA